MNVNLCTNMLVEDLSPASEHKIDRVLWIDPQGIHLVLIQVNNERALPRCGDRSDFEHQLTTGHLRCLKTDPFLDLGCSEEAFSEAHKKRRDKAWALIAPVI